jgi:hypothetical protein
MKMKTTGMIMFIVGLVMLIYTGFNFVTTKNVVDLGPIKIDKQENHPVQWSPAVGIALLAGGVVVFLLDKRQAA